MARTFIGELILKLKDQMTGEAKAAAEKLDTSIGKIEKTAARLNNVKWGGRFEDQLQKLGAGANDIEKLRAAYNRMITDMNGKGLSKSDMAAQVANFKIAALSEFGQIRHAWATNAKAMEARTRMMATRFQNMMKPILVAMGGYTGVYMAGVVGREGVTASSEWEREKWRQKTANIPEGEKDQIIAAAEKLGAKYPSAGITNIAEMARTARTMMGTTERGLAVLPDLVRGLVALQSAKNPQTATDQLNNLLRGIDNAGQNKGGDIGIAATKDIIAGMIRAAQMENGDIDVGKFFQFARRGKIAVPGLSTEFLANIQPALSQDMTPEGFGTALSSAYQAFVIGSNAVASRKNIARQKEIGIRDDNGLVDSELFGTNPYQWVKKNLIPALQKQGVDMENETQVAQEVAQLTRNTNASGLLTRMITQAQQIDRLVEQYKSAMGPESAEESRFNDPFVAYKGFIESLRNLAAAVGEDTMPTIVAGLNGMADAINRFQQMYRDGDPLAKAGLVGAAGLAGLGTWKIMGAIWGLITAGTNLNAAALSLEAAAASLAGGGALGDLTDKPGKKGWMSRLGNLVPWLGALGARVGLPATAAYAGYSALDSVPHDGMASALKHNPNLMAEMDVYRRLYGGVQFEGGMHRAGLGAGPKADYKASVNEAKDAGREIQSALSVQATPQINLAQLQQAIAMANQFVGILRQAGAAIGAAHASVAREMNRNFADHGVNP